MRPAALLSGPIRFGAFEMRPAERLLLRDGRPCRLGGRAFDVLALLLEHADRIVGRAEILDRVWPGLAVEPNNLQVQMWALRRLLGPSAIVTVPRRGYRYVGPPPVPAPASRWAPAQWVRGGRGAAEARAGGGDSLRARLRWQSRGTR